MSSILGVLVLGIVMVVAVNAMVDGREPPQPVAAPGRTAPAPAAPEAPPAVASRPPARVPATQPAAEVPQAEAPIVLDRPLEELDPETRARLEARLARERAAEARFAQGIERSQVRARDIDTRLREALERVDFEPELLDGGLMRGLRIRSIVGGSPLDEAGFRPGDLVVRLAGHPLEDPAELPEVLASSGPELSICARRGASEFCRDLVLR
jgi:hypothetical protein